MRVFVTGAAGFLGRNFLARLAQAGHTATALLLPAEADAGLPPARVVRGDITEPSGLAGLIEGHDAVLHLASLVGYGQRMGPCLRVNRDGTRHVAEAAAAAGVRRFVFLSSVSVYGRATAGPIDEEAPFRETGDPYGDTKIAAERILHELEARGALDLTCLRPTVIYGPGDDKFLPRLVANVRQGRARVVGAGRHRVDAVHVDDVAELVGRVLTDPRASGRVYNVGCADNPSWRDFVAQVAEAAGAAPPRTLPYTAALAVAGLLEWRARLLGGEPAFTRYAVRVIGRPCDYVFERAQRELGWRAQLGLAEGFRRWWQACEARAH